MSSLNVFVGSGRISKKTFRSIGNDGTTVCQLNVPINIYKPGKNGAEATNETMWFDMSAFGRPTDKYNAAEKWNEKFQEGQYVTFQGSLNFRTYESKGETKVSFMIDNARVDWSAGAPKEAQEATDNNEATSTTTTPTAKSKSPFFG